MIAPIRQSRLISRTAGLSGLTMAGQLAFLGFLPVITRIYSPSQFGVFTIYLAIVNIAGPLAGMKFDAALFGIRTEVDRCRSLCLALAAILVTSVVSAVLVVVLQFCFLQGSQDFSHVAKFIPVGVLLSGSWSVSTSWAIGQNAIKSLSIARFVQPFTMGVLQVALGYMFISPIMLIVAHLLSHVLYSAIIFRWTISSTQLMTLRSISREEMWACAKQDVKYPLFVMPAFLLSLLIGNAPPLLMGALFGTGVSGHFGLAYRVVTGPLSAVCLPLCNVFTSEASQSGDRRRLRSAAVTTFVIALSGVSIPLLLLGVAAPTLAVVILGPEWRLAGSIMATLAWMGAAHALAAPFNDVPSIYRRQEVRFLADALQALLFFGPLGVGTYMGWEFLTIMRAMAAGGACGYIIGAVASALILFNHAKPAAAGDCGALSGPEAIRQVR